MKEADLFQAIDNMRCSFGPCIVVLRLKDEKEFFWTREEGSAERLVEFLRRGGKPMFLIGVNIDPIFENATFSVQSLAEDSMSSPQKKEKKSISRNSSKK